MKSTRVMAQLLIVALLLSAMFGVALRVNAQEAVGTIPDAGTPVSAGYVSASCAFDGANDQSSCSFTLGSSSDAPAQAFTAGSSLFCSAVLSVTSGEWADGGIRQSAGGGGSGEISATLSGLVQTVAGGGAYSLETDSGPMAIDGDALTCSSGDAPVDLPVVTSDVAAASVPSAGSDQTGSGSEGTPVAVGIDVAPSAGTLDASPSPAVETSSATETVVPPIANASVSVRAFDCTSDPGGSDPSTIANCVPSIGLSVATSIDGAPQAKLVTNAQGSAAIVVPVGSLFTATQDIATIPVGFLPFGDGFASFKVDADATITFVHLSAPLVGRIQIVTGACPTSGEATTVYRFIEPQTSPIASESACAVTPGAVTIVSGSGLSSPITAVSGDDGAWRAYLPFGTYTLSHAGVESEPFTVVADDIVVAVVTDYTRQATGDVSVMRQTCVGTAADVITVSGSEIAGEPSCNPSLGQIAVSTDDPGVAPAMFDFSAEGLLSFSLRPGDYTLRDVTSGVSSSITVVAGQRAYVAITSTAPADGGVTPGGGDGSGDGGNAGGDPIGSGDGSGSVDGSDQSGQASDASDVAQSASGSAGSGAGSVNVSALPDTGSGIGPRSGPDIARLAGMLLLLATALGASAGWSRRDARRGR